MFKKDNLHLFIVIVFTASTNLAFDFSNTISTREQIIQVVDMPSDREYDGVSFFTKDGRLCTFVTSLIDNLYERANIYLSCQKEVSSNLFTTQTVLENVLKNTLIYNLNIIEIKNVTYLYFTAVYNAHSTYDSFWYRLKLNKNYKPDQNTLEKLPTPFLAQGQSRPWFFPYVLNETDIIFFYEVWDYKKMNSVLNYSVINNQNNNIISTKEIYIGAQLTRFSKFKDKTWAFGFQVGKGADMMDFIILSKDNGKTLSEPIAISQRKNVHDLYLMNRLDGNLDIYYIVADNFGFSLFRRKLTSDGTLGSEEKLTLNLNVQKPRAIRLKNKKIWVYFALVSGAFEESGHYGLILNGDAN